MDALTHYRTIIKALAKLAQMPGENWLARDEVMREVQRIRAAADQLVKLDGPS